MGPRFRAYLATAVLVACGGKVLEDSGSITIGGPSRTVGGSSGSSGRSGSSGSAIANGGDDGGLGYPSYPDNDGGLRFPNGPNAEIDDAIMAYTSAEPQPGLSVDEKVHATFENGLLYGVNAISPLPPDPTAGAFEFWAWGSPKPATGRFFYALGQQVPLEDLSHVPDSVGFQVRGAAVDDRINGYEMSAQCVLSSKVCKIALNVHRDDRAVQFVPAATISGTKIFGDGLSDKSHLRGGFTCANCAGGALIGFGIVIAFQIEDDVTHEILYGAAALPFFDPK